MTTWEQLIHAYVAEGKTDWHDLSQAQKEALAIAFYRTNPLDVADAVFPTKAAARAILANVETPSQVGRMFVQGMVVSLALSEVIEDAFAEARDEYHAAEILARQEPDPDEELPCWLKPQALA